MTAIFVRSSVTIVITQTNLKGETIKLNLKSSGQKDIVQTKAKTLCIENRGRAV